MLGLVGPKSKDGIFLLGLLQFRTQNLFIYLNIDRYTYTFTDPIEKKFQAVFEVGKELGSFKTSLWLILFILFERSDSSIKIKKYYKLSSLTSRKNFFSRLARYPTYSTKSN